MKHLQTTTSRPSTQLTLLVFQVADQPYAVSSREVVEILPMAELHSPLNAPKLLAGFLDLSGDLIPVIRLHYLFGLPEVSPQVWTPLVILRDSGRRLGLVADSVNRTLTIEKNAILPLPRKQLTGGCVTGIVRLGDESLSLLSPAHLLLEEERRAVTEMQHRLQQRISAVEGIPA